MPRGIIPSVDAFGRIRAAVLDWERTRGRRPVDRRRRVAAGPRRVLRGILLEDCPNDGTADCAVTDWEDSDEVQEVALVGTPTGGTFALTFDGAETDPIPWDATAEELQAALEALGPIGPGGVVVSIGKTAAHNPAVWLVQFVGPLAATDVPLLGPISTDLEGATLATTATQSWADSGRVETVRNAIPTGSPTPLRAGAVVLAEHWGAPGFVILVAEPRQYSPYS